MPLFCDSERYASRPPIEHAVDPVRIDCEDQAEWSVDNRHHYLELNTCAASDTGVCSRQELHLLGPQHAFAVEDLPRQLPFLHNPGVSDVQVWGHRKNPADDRDTVLQIQDALRVTTNVNDIVKRTRNGISRFGIRNGDVPHDVSNGRNLPELESAYVEISSKEKPLVVWNRRASET